MEIREANNKLESLRNNLELYLNLKEKLLLDINKITGGNFDLTGISAKRHDDKYLSLLAKLEEYDKEINKIQDNIFIYQDFIDKELKRQNLYGEFLKTIIYYKEEYVIPLEERKDNRIKLTWNEIAKKVNYDRDYVRKTYRIYKNKRNI